METIINDLDDLRKYIKVSKETRTITLKFEDVVFNCALPSKNNFNYFQDEDIGDYTLILRANNIIFKYYVEWDNIYAKNVESEDTIICRVLNVIGKTIGGYIAADMLVGVTITANTLVVKKICCRQLKSAYLSINKKEYNYIQASSINNIGVRYGRD